LAFAVNPRIKKSVSGDLILPIYWQDNYFPLLPGEKRRLKVDFNIEDLGTEEPLLVIDGWNIKSEKTKIIINP
jgi:exo-1,4-beta-D-glucosaminidase